MAALRRVPSARFFAPRFIATFLFVTLFASTFDGGVAFADDLEEARELYEVGNAHYAAARYEKAAKAFKKGYELSQLPGFLYNLANAYERMGEYRLAAEQLEIYLKSPKAKDVVSVKERVRRLEAAAEEREREIAKQQAREEEIQRLARLRGETRDKPRYEDGPRSPTYLYFVGGGGAALAVSGISALVSQSAATSAAAGCQGMICNRDVEGDLDREKTFAVVTDISLGVGVVLIGVGAYLYLKGPPRRRVTNSRDDRFLDDSKDSDEGDDDENDEDEDEDEDEDDEREQAKLQILPTILHSQDAGAANGASFGNGSLVFGISATGRF